MRPDVAEDPAIARLVPEPVRPVGRMDAVRAEPDGLDDATDGSRLDELPGLHRRAVLETLAVHDRVDPFRLRLYSAGLRQLFESGDARLVGHVVLAVLHDP